MEVPDKTQNAHSAELARVHLSEQFWDNLDVTYLIVAIAFLLTGLILYKFRPNVSNISFVLIGAALTMLVEECLSRPFERIGVARRHNRLVDQFQELPNVKPTIVTAINLGMSCVHRGSHDPEYAQLLGVEREVEEADQENTTSGSIHDVVKALKRRHGDRVSAAFMVGLKLEFLALSTEWKGTDDVKVLIRDHLEAILTAPEVVKAFDRFWKRLSERRPDDAGHRLQAVFFSSMLQYLVCGDISDRGQKMALQQFLIAAPDKPADEIERGLAKNSQEMKAALIEIARCLSRQKKIRDHATAKALYCGLVGDAAGVESALKHGARLDADTSDIVARYRDILEKECPLALEIFEREPTPQ